MKTLETQRLLLRGWETRDLDDLYAYARDPAVGPNAGWPAHASKADSATILQRFMEDGEVWAIEHKADRLVIGSIGLHRDRLREGVNSKMLGYVLAQPYWGQGLMVEAAQRVIQFAFEEMGLDILAVYHYPHNVRSRRVIEKCGFVHEGTLRQGSKLFDGTVQDSVCYSILRGEYFGC